MSGGPSTTPGYIDRQIELVQRALAPLARAVRRSLKEEGGDSLRVLQVWQHVNEALQILQAGPAPAREVRVSLVPGRDGGGRTVQECVDSGAERSGCSMGEATNSRIASRTRSGSSSCGQCPEASRRTTWALGSACSHRFRTYG